MQNAILYSISAAALSLALLANSPNARAQAFSTPPPRNAPPSQTGQFHGCANYYPQAALRMAVQGTAILAFTIGVDGIPRDVSVVTSSGNADLDEAAMACVKTWLYKPATRDGVPIATSWKASVAWAIPQSPTAPSPPTTATGAVNDAASTHPVSTGRPHTCGDYPEAAIENMASGTTTLQFTIDAKGWTRDISVHNTSGNKDLDQAAIECASHWRYFPAVKDGMPVAVPWLANIVWTMPTVNLPVGFNPLAHACAQAFRFAQDHHEDAFMLRLAFFVNADGSVGTPRILRSSQDFELDSAFVTCVGNWAYTPAKRGLTPVRVVWGAMFETSPQTGPEMREGPPAIHFCPAASYVLRAASNGTMGTTVLKFVIDRSGHPDQIEIAESSGNSALDDAAKACAAGWTYGFRGGQTTPTPWSAQIVWNADTWSFAGELGNGDDPALGEPPPPPVRTRGGI